MQSNSPQTPRGKSNNFAYASLLPKQYSTITAEKLLFWKTNSRHVFYCGVEQVPLSWWFLKQMVFKIDTRLEPATFLAFQQNVANNKITLELRNYRQDANKNEFLAANALSVCVYQTYKYLESKGMRNVPLPVFVVPLSKKTVINQLPKLVDLHNDFLDHFGMAVAAYWRAKQQRLLRLNPRRKVMERRLDMEIETAEVANFREIVTNSLNVTGWNRQTKLLIGASIDAIYPNAEGMLSLGRAREVVVNIEASSSEDDDSDNMSDNDNDISVVPPPAVTIKPEPIDLTLRSEQISVGMWGAL